MSNINIVYISDHNYIFYTAVSLNSLLSNADSSNKYIIHLIIDASVIKEDKDLFCKLQAEYDNVEILYYNVNEDVFSDMDYSYTYLNNSTLYRLLTPSLLRDIDKVIYLDADTIAHRDLVELIKTDMQNSYIAGVWDMGMESIQYKPEGIKDMETYVNAGVLVMNLELMRQDNMQEKFISMIPKKYYYNDQDILNISCYGKIKLLPEKYNYFSYRDDFNQHVVISHFLSWEGLRPWQNLRAIHAKEWWSYAEPFKETEWYKTVYQKALDWYNEGSLNYILSKCKEFKHVYIWGSVYPAIRLERGLINNSVDNIAGFIDNDESKQASKIFGKDIVSPYSINAAEDILIINTARRAESVVAIEKQLLDMGFDKSQLIRYRQHPLGFYTFLDPKYKDEEIEEFFKWEYKVRNFLG